MSAGWRPVGNVLAFRRAPEPEPELERATFDVAWGLLTDVMRRRSEAKAKCEALWNREAKRLNGQEDLLARLKTYLRDDKDIPRTGGPGLQVLLRTGRLDHWQPMQQTPRLMPAFDNKEARQAVAAYKGEGFCRSYLDPCRIEGTTLVVRTDIAIRQLREVAVILKGYGFTGMRKRCGEPGTNAEHQVGGGVEAG
jgi:hypothetical protein